MFEVQWDNLMQSLVPKWWRRQRYLDWLRVLLSELRSLYNEFMAFRSSTIYKMTVTGQTMSLENALNDRFDPQARGIYIENLDDLTQLYLYNKVEVRPPLYIYNKWSAAIVFAAGEFTAHRGSVYVTAAGSVGQEPSLSSPAWEYVRPVAFLINKGEALQAFDFIVWVPITLTFDPLEMRALINTYKLAGIRYTINTY